MIGSEVLIRKKKVRMVTKMSPPGQSNQNALLCNQYGEVMNVCLSTFTCTKSVKFYFYVLVIKIPYLDLARAAKIWYISKLLKVEEKHQLWMQAIEPSSFFVLLLRNLSAKVI